MAVVADPEDLADALLSGTVDAAGIELSAEAPLLAITDLSVDFPTVDGVVHAVRGLTFSLRPGEVLAGVGEGGSGTRVTGLAGAGRPPGWRSSAFPTRRSLPATIPTSSRVGCARGR